MYILEAPLGIKPLPLPPQPVSVHCIQCTWMLAFFCEPHQVLVQYIHVTHCSYSKLLPLQRGEEQNREEGEMAQKKLGGGRNRGKSREEGEKET